MESKGGVDWLSHFIVKDLQLPFCLFHMPWLFNSSIPTLPSFALKNVFQCNIFNSLVDIFIFLVVALGIIFNTLMYSNVVPVSTNLILIVFKNFALK